MAITWSRTGSRSTRNRCTMMILLLCFLGTSLQAQESSEKEEDETLVVEAITVTAEKREKTLQETPGTLTVLSESQLEEARVENTLHLQQKTPGLLMTTDAAHGQPYIRGVGMSTVGIGHESPVGVYVDGVYQSRDMFLIHDFYDVERVEVFKGPQGTLYGRNATGGAIGISTRKPQLDFGGELALELGNYDRKKAQGVLNMPLANERVLTRLSFFTKEQDGYAEDPLNDRDYESEDLISGRLQFRFLISDDVDFLLQAQINREDASRSLGPKLNDQQPAPVLALNPTLFDDPREIAFDGENFSDLEQTALTGTLTWDIGNTTLTSITGWRDWDLLTRLDADSTNIAFVNVKEEQDGSALTQELRLASNGEGRLQWMLGFYYLDEEAFQSYEIAIAPDTPGAFIFEPNTDVDISATAVFGQVDFAATDRLDVFAGLRYSHEEKDYQFLQKFFGQPSGSEERNPDWSAWTPRLGFQFQETDQRMWYLSAARGFKSGGINNIVNAPSPDAFDPEFLWHYEVGMKSMWADRRLRFNAAAFLYDYSDLQVNLNLGPQMPTVITNAAEAEITGLEVSLAGVLNTQWELETAFSFLDANYKSYATTDPESVDPGIVRDLSGNQMPKAPRFSGTLGLRYQTPLQQGGRFTAFVDYSYLSKVYFDQFESDVVQQSAYGLLGAHFGYQTPSGRWHFSVFGENLTDELYSRSVIRATALIGTLSFYGDPRLFGIKAAIQF